MVEDYTEKVIFSEKSSISGNVTAPPSKSYSHRLIFLSLISKKSIQISNLLYSNDVIYTIKACTRLGLQITKFDEDTIQCNSPDEIISDEIIMDCGNSGTTIRFLIGLILVISGKIILSGEFFERNRPILPLVDALKNIGADYSLDENELSIELLHIHNTKICIRGDISSQFLSGLIFGIIALGLRPEIAHRKGVVMNQFCIETITPIVSSPYIELTKELLAQFGIHIRITTFPDGRIAINFPDEAIQFFRFHYTIPGDYSSAAPLLIAGILFGGMNPTIIRNLPMDSPQADRVMIDILKQMEMNLICEQSRVILHQSETRGTITPIIKIDCRNNPDLFPMLCVLSAYRNQITILYGINHVRYKETNRVIQMVRLLQEFGIQINHSKDQMKINGKSEIQLQSNHFITTVHDHRILMALCVFCLGVTYNGCTISLEHVERIKDSYPNFLIDLKLLGGNFTLQKNKKT